MNTLHNRIACLLILSVAFALLLCPAYCQPQDVSRQIQQVLQKGDASFEHKDVDECLAMLTDDFQGTDIRGTHFSKAGTRRSLVKMFAPDRLMAQSARINSKIVKVVATSQSAKVLYREHLVITLFTYKKIALTLDALRSSVWVKTKGVWQEQKETQLTSRITQNGVLKSVQDSRK